ncbi:MAG TPA: hypothetical protein VF175_00395 [Lacipirellula sp.]
MKLLPVRRHAFLSAAITFAAVLVLSTTAQAATINYGDFNSNPPGVMFLNVTESSGTDAVPLYGAPTFVGLDLGFTPTPAFNASAGTGSVDVTDGQLNYTIMSAGVATISAQEGGNFSFGGVGGVNTSVLAALSLRATVTQINGADVTPIVLPQSHVSVQHNMAANPAGGPWSLATSLDVPALLAGLGYGPGSNATKVNVVIDNQLAAVSELTSSATITKTRFGVPEPGSAALAGLALVGCGLVSRRGR